MIAQLRHIAKRYGYVLYKEPFRLNIWGVRSKNETPNRFDDELHVFFNTSQKRIAKWTHYLFKCTTDPGTYWLKNPMSPQGTAMLYPGQYIDVYKVGLHRGKYYALVQGGGNVTVMRDYNRNAILDFYNGRLDTGRFGINIHRAKKKGTTYEVENHSAGCQVFQKADEFNFFMTLCEKHRELYGNKFTYTLIDQRMEFRTRMRRFAIGLTAATVITAGLMWVTENQTEEETE
ncbi:MAG: hypothetical protein HYZ14_15300 [Bacteroidetes bacterium]|nr:hypothetical protein [Bacteroidota bacterium]